MDETERPYSLPLNDWDSSETEDRKFIPNNLCLNCCNPVLSGENNSPSRDPGPNDVQYKENSEPEPIRRKDIVVGNVKHEISKVLHQLYRYGTEDDWAENVCICSECFNVLEELFVLYHKFENLRSLGSYLSKKLELFHTQFHSGLQVAQDIPCDVSIVTEGNNNDYSEDNFQDVIFEDPLGSESDENLDDDPKLDPTYQGPWVCLNRVEVETPSPRRRRGRPKKSGAIEQIIIDVDSDEGDICDNDYIPRKRGRPKKSGLGHAVGLENNEEDGADPGFQRIKTQRARKTGQKSTNAGKTSGADSSPTIKKRKGRARSSTTGVRTPSAKKKKKKKGPRMERIYRQKKLKYANPCWHCDEYFETLPECLAHSKEVHLPEFSNGVFCEDCGRVSSSEAVFAQHNKSCAELLPGQLLHSYKCPHCLKVFAFRYVYEAHLPQHDAIKPFPCPEEECKFSTHKKILLTYHMQRIHPDPSKGASETATCELCSKTFKTALYLKQHKLYMHTEDGHRRYREYARSVLARQKVERKARLDKQSYVCEDCNVDLFTRLMYVTHRKMVHKEVKQFVCEQCGKDFSRVHALQHHIRYAHTEDRPFICEHCGKGFKTSNNLKDHVNRTHSEEGRLRYNEKMRLHNQRRKLVAQALAHKSQVQQQDVPVDFSRSDNNGGGHGGGGSSAFVTSSAELLQQQQHNNLFHNMDFSSHF